MCTGNTCQMSATWLQGKINCGASLEPDLIQNYFLWKHMFRKQNFRKKCNFWYNNTIFSPFWSILSPILSIFNTKTPGSPLHMEFFRGQSGRLSLPHSPSLSPLPVGSWLIAFEIRTVSPKSYSACTSNFTITAMIACSKRLWKIWKKKKTIWFHL